VVNASRNDSGLLGDIIVVDLAGHLAEATGRVLADLGAMVIKVEPPEGAESRFRGPFDQWNGESLHWRNWGRGKHSVVLDLASTDGRSELNRLIDGADILIESCGPEGLVDVGLDADEIRIRNPGLVHVSVTPFGVTGPLAGAPATDLTLAAAGGYLIGQGDKDRPPVPIGFPESANHGAVQAAADAIAALYERDRSGLGQRLDSSMQVGVVGCLLWTSSYAVLDKNPRFLGDDRADAPDPRGSEIVPGLRSPKIEPCADGHVAVVFVLGTQGETAFSGTLKWVEEEGALDADLCGRDWTGWVQRMESGELPVEIGSRAMDAVLKFLKTKTKIEIHNRSMADKLLMAPCNDAADLLADPQLHAREFWVDVGGELHPGPFATLSRTPITYDRPAPALGEDQEIIASVSPKPAPTVTGERGRIYEGLKVVDFTWMAAGPIITRELANHGATVIHPESANRVDSMRLLPPWNDSPASPAGSIPAANVNQSKLGVACDLGRPQSRDLVDRLIAWADVVVENFRPGVAEKAGFGWDRVHELNPRVVMLSTSMRGQTGPEAGSTGFGVQGAALGGFVDITGWPDRAPISPWGAYTDFVSPRFGLAALVAALRERDRSGIGQYIDVSQNETGIHFLGPLVLDHVVNGSTFTRPGVSGESGAPSGVFAGAGTERYIAVSAITETDWNALRSVVAPLAVPVFDSLSDAERMRRRPEIERVFAEWSIEHDVFVAAHALLEAGCPAYATLRPTDLIRDPQLEHRGFFTMLPHEVMEARYDGPLTHFSDTPWAAHAAGPTVGQHNDQVLREILGLHDAEITALDEAGVLR
jgi:crotonobetainyl-CoA:carnitine CoA-transferase CaiB-like acyl-CoA transferase